MFLKVYGVSMNCICGLEKDYSECCEIVINGRKIASSPEELMRSRYSAFVKENWEYIAKTSTSQTIEELKNSVSIKWLKLDVINTYDDIVEFKAYYKDTNNIHILHEKSNFKKENGLWKYVDGELYNSQIQRNESCPCGSGRKYKKCCSNL